MHLPHGQALVNEAKNPGGGGMGGVLPAWTDSLTRGPLAGSGGGRAAAPH